ncbi:hypothetical protein Vretifemale_8328 [Volvox reticuliferus]|uniref:Uncharacterized protein n=1 Tax=Volvox reticuliferus TaxID=1737510 RepID=A0A8J4CF43_9CHLO|nr:hypothetical protein Vretifemale_8328 [Volvox reticuliferus]
MGCSTRSAPPLSAIPRINTKYSPILDEICNQPQSLTANLASSLLPVGPKFTNVPAFCELPLAPADPDDPAPEPLGPSLVLAAAPKELLDGTRSGTDTGLEGPAALPSNRRPVPANARNLGSSGSGAEAGPAAAPAPAFPSAAAGAAASG